MYSSIIMSKDLIINEFNNIGDDPDDGAKYNFLKQFFNKYRM